MVGATASETCCTVRVPVTHPVRRAEPGRHPWGPALPTSDIGLPFEFAAIRVDDQAHESALPANEAVVEPQ